LEYSIEVCQKLQEVSLTQGLTLFITLGPLGTLGPLEASALGGKTFAPYGVR